MQLALKEELAHRLICMQEPQVQPNEVLSPVLKVLCFMAPANSCSYISEAGYLPLAAVKWNAPHPWSRTSFVSCIDCLLFIYHSPLFPKVSM